jgi:hypothetical protein
MPAKSCGTSSRCLAGAAQRCVASCERRPTLPRYVVFERRGFVLAGGLHGAHATARLYLLAGGTFPFGCSTNSTL